MATYSGKFTIRNVTGIGGMKEGGKALKSGKSVPSCTKNTFPLLI